MIDLRATLFPHCFDSSKNRGQYAFMTYIIIEVSWIQHPHNRSFERIIRSKIIKSQKVKKKLPSYDQEKIRKETHINSFYVTQCPLKVEQTCF